MPVLGALAFFICLFLAAYRVPWLPWIVLAAYLALGGLLWAGDDSDEDKLIAIEFIGGGVLVLVGIGLGYGWTWLRRPR